MKRPLIWLVLVAAIALALAALVVALNLRGEDKVHAGFSSTAAPSADTVARGAYLVRAGNCFSCHTQRGGAPFAGGRAIETPFGTVYGSNLTPDKATGIGEWNTDEFWRALHNGRARDGRLLYPAFPYPNYTLLTRADADAIYAYLRTVPAVAQPNTPHGLRWPYSTQAALAVWRAMYFKPETYEPERAQPPEWNRGAYLVQGLGHCSACHTARNVLGANTGMTDLSGGLIPMLNWYAPALTSHESGVADWDLAEIQKLLKTGVAPRGSALGPMSEVVLESTQHLSDADLHAMAVYLKSLPAAPPANRGEPVPVTSEMADRGAKIYQKHCAQCHGDKGEGVAGAYPALAGNRAINLPVTANLVQIVLGGAFPPATAGNPRPFGMPPFATVLSDQDVAAVLSHIRNSWGNQSGAVSQLEVNQQRTSTRL
ncbi:cytochrome c [Ramlibacter solisilvae]|uniref:Alcohol dehydrogenase n=1 Tax=Ramlibacter tataouinensis TaxID=94132 RepID=A0A127JQ15_9BURK|nr:c-type cytochrome [Ramlibacter tataouinensis]AMO22029.1 alcohol dehydrogenase [Ramlibacter tataouinensis]